jgi:hypothetical protein
MIPFSLKKWYFDLVSPQGDVLYFYFITARIAGFALGTVSAHFLAGDGQEVRAIEKTPFAADADGSLRLGRHAFCVGKDGVEVRLEFTSLSLELAYSPRVAPWWPTDKGILLLQNGRTRKDLRWHVPVPYADVEGVITVDGSKRDAAGNGYLDIVETDIPPWRLPLAELHWGRAHFAEQTVVFNQIKTRKGEIIQNFLLTGNRRGPESGPPAGSAEQSFTLQADRHDARTSLGREGTFGLLLARRKVIEESPVVTAERFKSKFARRVLKRLTGDPREKKMISRASLELHGDSISGIALHERVSWHWPKEVRP